MRILIADDQVRVRQALRVLLAQQPGLRVIGEAADGAELLAQVGVKAADLALVDWELPGLAEAGGLPALRGLPPPGRCLERPDRRSRRSPIRRCRCLREQG